MGPFTDYVEPGVYTQTLTDNTITTLTGGIRIPLLIGVGSETLQVTDYEIIRGSSATIDNYMTNEDVSSQLTGTNRTFIVSHFPVVDGTGKGVVTKDPTKVTVTVDGEPAGVASIVGASGKITLSSIPAMGAKVKVSYFFKRTDTLVGGSKEFPNWDDLSDQANGTNMTFKVDFGPIVDGTNGGVPTTDITKVQVKVKNPSDVREQLVAISSVHGSGSTITLEVAPALGAIVTASYYTNTWMDTFDYLPVTNVTQVIRVGTAPGRTDYLNSSDFVIQGNQIQWGNSYTLHSGITESGTNPVDSNNVTAQIMDNRIYMAPCAEFGDNTKTSFTLEYLPTDGSGKGEPTDDIHTLIVYVGAGVQDAIAKKSTHPEKSVVLTLDGATKSVVLKQAPALGERVYVTYYYNFITDDIYTITCQTPSVPSVSEGTYTIVSTDNGDIYDIVLNTSNSVVNDPNFNIEGPLFPDNIFDGQTIPGYTPEAENIFIHFFTSTDYIVFSSIGSEGTNGSGSLGQTYVDEKTGTRFTLLPGITVTYVPGDLIELNVSKTFTTSGIYKFAVPGLKVLISQLDGVYASNTGILITYNKSGKEPAVGDVYYVTLKYAKTDYPIKVYTKLKDITSDFGDVNTDNRLSLAGYIAFSNGAIALAMAQVLRDNTGVDATVQSYSDVFSAIESTIKNTNVNPNIICPITTNQEVINNLRIHCEKMSSIRYKKERTGVFGFAVGVSPESAQVFAESMNSERMIGVYPDGAIVSLVDQFGNVNQAAVDGSFLAAAFTGLAVNPIYDVATPLTHKTLTGFSRLISQLDAVTMNQTAVAGLTVLEDAIPNILIRQAMTTNPANVLTREPTVIYIKDYVQQQIRAVLDPFIGVKLLPSVIQDIETTLNNLLNQLVNNEIITAFTGVSAEQDANDPTILRTECYYSPVLPLNWLIATQNLRVRL